MIIRKEVAPRFEEYLLDWDYETYIQVGGYGSGKSYNTALKIVLKLFEEKRKCLVIRNVYSTLEESCFSLIAEILESIDLLTEDRGIRSKTKVRKLKSPLKFIFPNGSQIIFRGMDNPEKIKSINGVSIVWIEEPTEISYDAYLELLGRIRTPDLSMHYLLTFNPVGKENWIYDHFFKRREDDGSETIIIDEELLYTQKVLIKGKTYYSHTIPEDNPYLPKQYIKRLEELKNYDEHLYNVAKLGRFGAAGTRVLPQLMIAEDARTFKNVVNMLGPENMYFGFDFGFEDSYNAIISMSVDLKSGILYIWDEIYVNHVTDYDMANMEELYNLNQRIIEMNRAGINKQIVADNEDPKAIAYYRQCGYYMRPCRNKFAGSRLSNTRKIKRFKKIIVSPKCKNVRRELKDLTYKKDSRGNVIYDQFNIDPHTFSAIWYALDNVTVADLKERKTNSKRG